jgi:hypothetical protein
VVRVAVVGKAAGGKSTLARQLSVARELPYLAVDKIQWQAGWQPVPAPEVRRRHAVWLAGPGWVIEGFGDWADVKARFDAADTIVFVDLPFWQHLLWAGKRQIKAHLNGWPDAPPGCGRPPPFHALIAMMWRLHFESRGRLLELIEASRHNVAVHHLKSRRDISVFIAEFCTYTRAYPVVTHTHYI